MSKKFNFGVHLKRFRRGGNPNKNWSFTFSSSRNWFWGVCWGFLGGTSKLRQSICQLNIYWYEKYITLALAVKKLISVGPFASSGWLVSPYNVKIFFNSMFLHIKKQLRASLTVQKVILKVSIWGFRVNGTPKLCQNIYPLNFYWYQTPNYVLVFVC